MLRRDRQMRMQLHQVMDACIFAFSFWLAYIVRTNPAIIDYFGMDPVDVPFKPFAWLFLVVIPAGPLILEAQGFYDRPMLCSRGRTSWLLFKGCSFTVIVVILASFLSRSPMARGVPVLFGAIAFGLVFLKEELFRFLYLSQVGQSQLKRHFVLIGTADETARLRKELRSKSHGDIEVLAELDLNEASGQKLVELLHEHSVNGVILSAKHAYFEQVEAVDPGLRTGRRGGLAGGGLLQDPDLADQLRRFLRPAGAGVSLDPGGLVAKRAQAGDGFLSARCRCWCFSPWSFLSCASSHC